MKRLKLAIELYEITVLVLVISGMIIGYFTYRDWLLLASMLVGFISSFTLGGIHDDLDKAIRRERRKQMRMKELRK